MILDGNAFRLLGLETVGSPYRMGAEVNAYSNVKAPKDCSELTQFLYSRAWAIELVDGAVNQYYDSRPISYKDIRVGDLGFKSNTYKPGVSHVAAYIGDGLVVQAKDTASGTIITKALDYSGSSKFSGWRRPNVVRNYSVSYGGVSKMSEYGIYNATTKQYLNSEPTPDGADTYVFGTFNRNRHVPTLKVAVFNPGDWRAGQYPTATPRKVWDTFQFTKATGIKL